jgi:hypothetical protein
MTYEKGRVIPAFFLDRIPPQEGFNRAIHPRGSARESSFFQHQYYELFSCYY